MHITFSPCLQPPCPSLCQLPSWPQLPSSSSIPGEKGVRKAVSARLCGFCRAGRLSPAQLVSAPCGDEILAYLNMTGTAAASISMQVAYALHAGASQCRSLTNQQDTVPHSPACTGYTGCGGVLHRPDTCLLAGCQPQVRPVAASVTCRSQAKARPTLNAFCMQYAAASSRSCFSSAFLFASAAARSASSYASRSARSASDSLPAFCGWHSSTQAAHTVSGNYIVTSREQ